MRCVIHFQGLFVILYGIIYFIGALQNGIADIKNHAFFSSQNIDFEKLLDQQIEMPYQPGHVMYYLCILTVGHVVPSMLFYAQS